MRVCINSQTPFIKFKLSYEDLLRKYGSIPYPIDIEQLVEGEDYEYSPGGVTAMIYPLLERMKTLGIIDKVNWLNSEELLRHISDSDVFYVQDFQLILTGHMIGPSAPAVLRWHVPFKP